MKSHLLKSGEVKLKFNGLCGDNSYSSEEKQLILRYVMDRYANMRGTYFVKCISGNQGTSATDVQVASLVTRTKGIVSLPALRRKRSRNYGCRQERV